MFIQRAVITRESMEKKIDAAKETNGKKYTLRWI